MQRGAIALRFFGIQTQLEAKILQQGAMLGVAYSYVFLGLIPDRDCLSYLCQEISLTVVKVFVAGFELFNINKKNTSILSPGDTIKFKSISKKEFGSFKNE